MADVTLIVGKPGTGKTTKMMELCAKKKYYCVFLSIDQIHVGSNDIRAVGLDGLDIINSERDKKLVASLPDRKTIRNRFGQKLTVPDYFIPVCGTLDQLDEVFKKRNRFEIIDLNA